METEVSGGGSSLFGGLVTAVQLLGMAWVAGMAGGLVTAALLAITGRLPFTIHIEARDKAEMKSGKPAV